MSKTLQWLIILVLIGFQLLRLIFFVNEYGGLEHDSGWFLGLGRSLAETGSYTTMVSTIDNPAPGGNYNIYDQYNVQDAEGRVYFFTESGVFGAGIIPNAMIIRLFGAGFWQYRTGALLFFALSLLLASYLLYGAGGVWPILIVHLYLLAYPTLFIPLGYEAMGEIFGLGYILLTFTFFITAISSPSIQKQRVWLILSGIAAGLAFITKPITLLSLGGLPLAWMWFSRQRRISIKEGGLIAVGGMIMPILWEAVQMTTLTTLFGFQTYQHHLTQRSDFFANEGGSGLGEKQAATFEFLAHKILVVHEIASAYPLLATLTLIILLIGGPLLVWHYYRNDRIRTLVILLWGGWVTHSIWFIGLSKTGWMRHDWYALILGVLLLSLLVPVLWKRVTAWYHYIPALIITVIVAVNFILQLGHIELFISESSIQRWYHEYLVGNHTRLPWILIPPKMQQDAVDSIAEHVPPDAHIFYPEGHKSAEMAVLTGRVLYPLQRRPNMEAHNQDVVLIGPSLISPWRKPTEAAISQAEQQAFIDEVKKQIERDCPHIIFENSYYILCALD